MDLASLSLYYNAYVLIDIYTFLLRHGAEIRQLIELKV